MKKIKTDESKDTHSEFNEKIESICTYDTKEAQEYWEENKEELFKIFQEAVLTGQPIVFSTIGEDEEIMRIVNASVTSAIAMIDRLITSFALHDQLRIFFHLSARMRYREQTESTLHVLEQLGIIKLECKEGGENEK